MTEPYMKKLSSTLLDAITDKDPLVQEQVCSALCSLGEVRPVEMLRACEEYLRQHDKWKPNGQALRSMPEQQTMVPA
ncbi:Maestro heat-like repeat-containing protein member 1 [Saguinus oedipus]|uniref:Maestro heat-like repeat-containing protein member 1 n=1 Tax=Saguinus oedipus TaxID=9490 RepID=A0ABQ9UDX9_SAGOE|nr:Maestro heat-like repeat-containing protein member 1 [Saguinus oedipus]